MKRFATLLLSLAMVFALAACGEGTGEPAQEPAPAPQQEDTEAPAPEPTGALPAFSTEAVIEETVLVDEDGVRITATALEYSGFSADLKLTIENNSGKDLSFTSGTLVNSCNSVNGMMVEDGYLNCDVAAGKKAVDTISFSYAVLQLSGIREIAELEVGLSAADEDFNSKNYPLKQIRTSAWSEGGVRADFQDTITSAAAQNTFGYEVLYFAADHLYEDAGAAVLSQTLVRDTDDELTLFAEVENQSQEMRVLSISGIVLNDLMVEGGTWTTQTIAPGKRGVLSVELSALLEECCRELCGIEEIGSISFDLQQDRMDGVPASEKKTICIACGDARPADTSGEVLYQQHEVSVIAKGVLGPDDGIDMGYSVLILAENKGQEPLKLEIPFETLAVNGYMADSFGNAWELKAGQRALMEIQLYEQDMEEIGVTEAAQISQVEFELEISRGKTVLDCPVLLMDLTERT